VKDERQRAALFGADDREHHGRAARHNHRRTAGTSDQFAAGGFQTGFSGQGKPSFGPGVSMNGSGRR